MQNLQGGSFIRDGAASRGISVGEQLHAYAGRGPIADAQRQNIASHQTLRFLGTSFPQSMGFLMEYLTG